MLKGLQVFMPNLSINSFVGDRDLLEHVMSLLLQAWGFQWKPVWMPDLDLGLVGSFNIFKRCAVFEF